MRWLRRRQNGKSGWVLYLMIHFPFIWWVKIGITGRTARKRAGDLEGAVFGYPIPVFVVILPEAYLWEQLLHGLCRPLRANFYRGDGASEWFWFPAAVPALVFMLSVWGLYFWLIGLVTDWDGLDWYLTTLTSIGEWIMSLIK